MTREEIMRRVRMFATGLRICRKMEIWPSSKLLEVLEGAAQESDSKSNRKA